jgi:hypothetical protein
MHLAPGESGRRFKASANQHIGESWALVHLLYEHDISIWMITSDRVGEVVYEDDFQIVAVPYADSGVLKGRPARRRTASVGPPPPRLP